MHSESSMHVTLERLWAGWIITLIVVGIIVWLILLVFRSRYATLSWGVVLFIAGLLAAIAVFVGAAHLDTSGFSTGQLAAFYILLILAILVPLIGLFLLFWRGETKCFSKCKEDKEEVVVVEEKVVVKEVIKVEEKPINPKCDPCHKHKIPIKSCNACASAF